MSWLEKLKDESAPWTIFEVLLHLQPRQVAIIIAICRIFFKKFVALINFNDTISGHVWHTPLSIARLMLHWTQLSQGQNTLQDQLAAQELLKQLLKQLGFNIYILLIFMR